MMKSTTCLKQTTTTLTSAPFAASGTASHHRHHPNQYRNNSINCRNSTNSDCNDIKMRPNDANNNDSSSMMMTTRTTTTKTTSTASLPIITSTPTRSSSKNSEKYSLRQRQKRSFTMPSSSAAAMPVMSSELKTALTLDEPAVKTLSHRSNLNSNTKPRSNTSTSGSKEKSKSKAAPLSKYRRKTANARERTRMREINSAFENLRHCVPHTITGDQTASSNEKLTKITTLRLAMKYIRVLSEALENPSFQEDFLLECHNDGDHRFSTPNWVQTPIHDVAINSEEDVPQAQPTATPQARPKQRKAKTQTTKVPSKRQRTKTKVEETLPQYSHSSSTFSSPFSSSSSSSAYASMSASPLFDDCHSMTDLSSMILESDGESLHLSEPCLSPMNRNYNLGLPSLDRITPNLLKTTPVTMETENPLELSLRLLEPDADSLDFSTDQQPSSCISPLATLDSFNPFGDFLHVEFPEHSSLDLFLT